ncbi:hypothetical protein GCM10025868_15740 [Angustibacter aerolatus]|uniref:Uncharacterized protein n=1 Tax=Angustibacter aerolatus TaxID=1162965 RepID=A0ABQ6JET8_9ACTN|nr:hypothetical protein GCM10025868_15740 [Angustibacter aerolatus]
MPVERVRLAVLALAAVLAAVAVGVAGPVPFVALVAAPVARRLTRSTGAVLLPAALVGALVTVVADAVGAHFLGPLQVPVGVLTGVVGGPYLLWLLARSNTAGRAGW